MWQSLRKFPPLGLLDAIIAAVTSYLTSRNIYSLKKSAIIHHKSHLVDISVLEISLMLNCASSKASEILNQFIRLRLKPSIVDCI